METFRVVATGSVTNVGLTAVETAASVRAGVCLCEESQWRDSRWQPIVFGGVVDDGLVPLSDAVSNGRMLPTRIARLVRLGATALAEALSGGKIPRPPLFLALPEHGVTQHLEPQGFLNSLACQTAHSFDLSTSSAEFSGRAGGLVALAKAGERIRRDPATPVLVGGVDSFDDPLIVDRLEADGRLKTPSNSDGFIPGEAAGVLLLASEVAVKKYGLADLAAITPPAVAQEEGHLYSLNTPYRGDGLARAVTALVATQSPQPIAEVYSSMNGEHYWAKEWGTTCTRNSAAFAPDVRLHHAVEFFGDIGAAFGPVAISLAVVGLQKGYRRSPILVYASSDYGQRVATILTINNN
ncbi:MAG: beta-ketoacyl synthase N-terminal-like domain-containing protein [Nibricoccus sp.]